MAPPLRRGRSLALQRLLGAAFVVVLVGAVGLSTVVYQQRFTPTTDVVLQADRAGNQLSPGADVKARGVIVGRVRSVASTGDGAELVLALDRDRARQLPRDVSARLRPKTLFGEKFVALELPTGAGGPPLRAGDVIGQDRSETARETQTALDGLEPLLQELRPQRLSTTLHAVSSALRGRGDRIGENLELVDEYLQALNPELPELQRANAGLADLLDTVDAAAPDLLSFADDSAFTSRSLVEERSALRGFLVSTAGMSEEGDSFLRRNEARLVGLAAESVPVLRLYERYSPQFPCFLAGLVETTPKLDDAMKLGGLHITLEFVENGGPFVEGDQSAYRDDDGPTCRGLPPGPPEVPFPFYRNGQDGYRDGQECDPRTGDCGPPDGHREQTYPR